MRAKQQLPIPPTLLQQERMNKKLFLDRDSGIVTETDSDVEYGSTSRRNHHYIFSDDDELATATAINTLHNFHSHLADQAVLSVRHYLKDDNWKKVLKHKSGTTVYMMQRTSKNEKIALFRGESVIQGFTPQSIFYVIGMRKLWDEQFDEGKLIENLNETTSLTYESYKSTATTKAHDYTLVEKIECSANGEILFACTSVDTPQVPKTSGKNRLQIKLQGWVLTQLDTLPVSTRVTYLTQENIKGWIPGLTKKSLARKPLIIASIDSYLQKKAVQQQQQKKSIPTAAINTTTTSNKNAASASSLLQTASCTSPPASILKRPSTASAPHLLFDEQTSPTLGQFNNNTSSSSSFLDSNISSNRPSTTTIILSNPPPRISSLSTSTAQQTNNTISAQQTNNSNIQAQPKRITFADQSIEHPSRSTSPSSGTTISSSFATSHSADTTITPPPAPPLQTQDNGTLLPSKAVAGARLYPTSRHRAARKQCIDRLQAYAHSNLSDWKHIGEKNNTQLYTQAIQGSTLPVMRSETTFMDSWTPEQICSVIQCFGTRKICKWDELFESGEIVERFSQKEYLVYTQIKSLFPIQSRDFSVLTCIESVAATGAVYIGSISVEDDMIPENSRHIRGTLFAYGWALKPITLAKDDNKWKMGVQVTFIAHMNMGRSSAGTTTPQQHLPLPSAIVRLLTTQTCAASIQAYLTANGCPPYVRRVAGKITFEAFDVENHQYTVHFIAKHAPSLRRHQQQQQQQQKQSIINSMWCTDIRAHHSMYPLGYTVETNQNVRVDIRPNVGLRIYTENDNLDGQMVQLVISKHTTGNKPQFFCNGMEVCAEQKVAQQPQDIAKKALMDHTETSSAMVVVDQQGDNDDDDAEEDTAEREEDETNDKTLYRRRNSHVIVLSQELSFTAHH
ncbi:hypothetical protein [Parasitella parasitica]|uniref:START domain-containing protein n=1 Tax=Parasitella parasitica TaxID=35722 RepID=A0A0B7N014_9FUNG|nr:hypothetical protein [Parasitella parasitica]